MKPDDEFEDFLQGKGRVHDVYREQATNAPEVSPHIDQLILQRAHQAVKPTVFSRIKSFLNGLSSNEAKPWLLPLSSMAILSIVVSIALLQPDNLQHTSAPSIASVTQPSSSNTFATEASSSKEPPNLKLNPEPVFSKPSNPPTTSVTSDRTDHFVASPPVRNAAVEYARSDPIPIKRSEPLADSVQSASPPPSALMGTIRPSAPAPLRERAESNSTISVEKVEASRASEAQAISAAPMLLKNAQPASASKIIAEDLPWFRKELTEALRVNDRNRLEFLARWWKQHYPEQVMPPELVEYFSGKN